MKNRPEVADEEIRSFMDFESILKMHGAQKKIKPIGRKAIWLTGLLTGVVGIALVIYFQSPYTETTQQIDNSTPVSPSPVKIDSSASSETKGALPAEEEKKEVRADQPQQKSPAPISKNEKVDSAKAKTENTAPNFIYVEAEPVEGFPHLYEYFNRELKYPEEGIKDSIQGVVTLTFLINKEGKPEQVKIQNSLGELFDREAQRLVDNMPVWKPATLNGKPVAARISIPLTFQILKSKEKE